MTDVQNSERKLADQPVEFLIRELVATYQKLDIVSEELRMADADRLALRQELVRMQDAASDVPSRNLAILHGLSEGLVIFDLQGNVLEMNAAALRLHGFDTAARAQRHLTEFAPGFEVRDLQGNPLDTVDWPLGRVLRGERLDGVEVQVRNATSGEVSVWSYNGGLIYDPDGSPLLGMLTMRDVTAQKAQDAERERFLADSRKQREFLEHLLQVVPLAIGVVSGPEHRFELANADYYYVPGRPASVLVGSTVAEVFPDLAPDVVRALEKVYRTGEAVHVSEYPAVVEPDGPERYWNADYVPMRDESGNVEKVLILIREVTDDVLARLRIEELAIQAQQQADDLDTVFEAMVEAVVVYDELDRPVKANRAARVAYGPALEGGNRAEVNRQLNLRHLDGRPVSVEETPVARACRGEALQGDHFLFSHARGGDRVVSATAAPLGTKDRPRGAVAVWHDVTAQVQAQQKLEQLAAQAQQQAQELDAVFEAIFEAVLVYDANGTLIAVNRAAREVCGLNHGGLSLADVIGRINARHPDGRPMQLEETAAARALKGKPVYGIPLLLSGVDGQERSVVASGAPLRESGGHPAGAVVVWHDVSEQARTLAALAAERARLEAVVDNAPEGIVLADEEGRVVLSNPAAERVYMQHLPFGEAHENGAQIKVCHPDGEIWEQGDQPLTRSALYGETWTEVEQLLVLPDGQRRSLLSNTAPIRDGLGRVTGAVGVFQDITEQVAVRETLLRQNEELQALTDELEAYDYTVAHDLKNPLSMIVGSADLLLGVLGDVEGAGPQRMLKNILEGSRRMNDIVESLLLLASTRSNEVQLGALDMATILARVRHGLEHEISRRGAELCMPAAWPAAMGYAPWIESVWTNYLSNGLKYGGDPPRLELGFDLGEPGSEGNPSEKCMFRFWIRDQGPGLSGDEVARLFVPFSRLDRPEKLGHGLGLALVRRIVEKLGGKVGVDSRQGEGSTFWFTLPRA